MVDGITNTSVRISEINDSGLFENLATSVLRSYDPLYHPIVQTGVNPSGRPIADPVDGFCISSNDLGEKYAIAVEHTTEKRASLSTKWLKPIKGDLPKALEKLKPYIDISGEYCPRIVLTSNLNPKSSLLDEVNEFGEKHSVEIDIWTCSRIAHVLDTTADGQTIRAQFFGTPQSRLSTELATKISATQINSQQTFITDDQLLVRAFERALPDFPHNKNRLVFIAGDSGMGKSTLCYQYARKVLKNGGTSFVLSHQLLNDCETFEAAINRCLREHSPALAKDQSLQAIMEIFEQKEILVWVEDVNRSDAPADLITKLNRITKTLLTNSRANDSRITILCPVQSKHLRGLSEHSREAISQRVSQLQPLDLAEARQAVKLAIKPFQKNLTNWEADRISKSLAFDPLLIGLLQDSQSSTTFAVEKIIPDYIKRSLDRCSLEHNISMYTLKSATISIANRMLEKGERYPSLEGLHTTLRNTDAFKCIEVLSADGSLFREVTHENNQVLYFRHDRIRDHLLVQAIQVIIERKDFDNEFLTDPFYVEQVSQAAINESPHEHFWEKCQSENPLVLFCSLKMAVKQNHISANELFEKCSYLIDIGLLEKLSLSYRLAVEWQISELTDDKYSSLIQATSVDSHAGREARVLSGDVLAAAELCYSEEPSFNSPYRDRLISHARDRYGQLWLDGISASLSRIETCERQREALLYLAGECAEVRLSGAVHQCWKNVKVSGNLLSCGMLYAAVSCGAGVTGFPLNEIFNHWSSLPEKHPDDDKPWLNPRYNVAEFGLSPGLRRIGTSRTIKPLLELAANEERMRHVIFLCLDKVDHPLAVTYVTSYIAKIDKDIEGKENHHNHVALSHQTISRHLANSYMRLSESSKAALKLIWTETANSFHDRKRAFQQWSDSMTSEDCLALTNLQAPDLADEILIARLRFSDRNVIPELRERLLTKDCNSYWIQYIPNFGSNGFEDIILKDMERRHQAHCAGEPLNTKADYVIPGLLAERDDEFARTTIINNWPHLKSSWAYPHLLLYLATKETLELFSDFFQENTAKRKIFKIMSSSFGIRVEGRSGIKRTEQLIALEPYLEYFDDHLISALWEECTEKGFLPWRKNHLDPLISNDHRLYVYIDEEAAFLKIDNEVNSDQRIYWTAYRWSDSKLGNKKNQASRIAFAKRYVDSRQNQKSAIFFSEFVKIVGLRKDLYILAEYNANGVLTQAQFDDANFSVRQRSLK